MKTKIKWFKEVLDLEPGSKVFFPLARLYYEDGLLDEAEETLLQGLERNSDHLEARFLLVEILDQQNESIRAADEVLAITKVLSRFPSFWKIWAQSAAPASRDSAMALSFLAANFQGRPISWSQVIEKGLDALVADGVPQVPLGAAQPVTAEADDANLRTRTMADLLAEQGDCRGALDIYEELAAKAGQGAEGDLAERIALMRSELGMDDARDEAGDAGSLDETVARFLNDLDPDGSGAAEQAEGADPDEAPDFDELAELEVAPDFDDALEETDAVEAAVAVEDLDGLDTLEVMEEDEPAVPDVKDEPSSVEQAVAARMPGKDQLMQTLEALAERLEARSTV